MSENTGYKGHWPPRPVKDPKEGQVVQFPEAGTGRILTGTVVVDPSALATLTALIELESGEYTWAWVHELSEKENDEDMSETSEVNGPETTTNPWRELWVEWFDFDGEPWYYDDEQAVTFCIFCGNNKEYGHDDACVYPKVKRLLDKEAR